MADKIVPALVEGIPFFDGVLHMPGEIATVNLTQHEAKSLDSDQIVGLTAVPGGGEDIAIVPIAAVAPHAPNPTAPQGVPAGTVQSPTGRMVAPATEGDAGTIREFQAAGADVSKGSTKK